MFDWVVSRGARVGLAMLAVVSPAAVHAQQPVRGGTLIFSASGDPDTFDCHSSLSVATQHRVAPHYSLLIKNDAEHYPRLAPDLAESWTLAADAKSASFTLRYGVKFHDGSALTSADVKATFDRIRNPPAGVNSLRKNLFTDVAEITTPDPLTVVFRLSAPDPAILAKIASPWNCIYSAALLASDPAYPAKKVMGTGPFVFKSYVSGSAWEGARFEDYFLKGQPYLDGFRILDLSGAGLLNALVAGQTMADFRGLVPVQRDRLIAGGGKLQIEEGPHNAAILVTFNTTRRPFDDVRVRRALALALDRKVGAGLLSPQSIFAYPGGFFRPGSEFARSADELAAFPGFGPDPAANKAEAKRLLAEAGVPDLSFTFTNNSRPDYTALGVYLIDQWRQIGVTAKHQQVELPAFFAAVKDANFDVSVDSVNEYSDDPVFMLPRYQSFDISSANSSRSTDRELDRLYGVVAHEVAPAVRKQAARDFEARLLNQAYFAPVLWSRRLIPLAPAVHGFYLTPSYYLGQDLLTVWLQP